MSKNDSFNEVFAGLRKLGDKSGAAGTNDSIRTVRELLSAMTPKQRAKALRGYHSPKGSSAEQRAEVNRMRQIVFMIVRQTGFTEERLSAAAADFCSAELAKLSRRQTDLQFLQSISVNGAKKEPAKKQAKQPAGK